MSVRDDTEGASHRIRLEWEGPVATIVIDRPEKRNAFNHAMWARLTEVIENVAGDPRLRVLLLRAEGEHFSAGGDIAEMGRLIEGVDEAAERLDAPMVAAAAMAEVAVPTIAVIRGSARGGGCELAVACDFRFADPTATFGIPPVRLGLVYGAAATHQLVATVGLPAARMLLLSAQPIGSDRAQEVGLVDRIYPPDRLDPEVRDFAQELAGHSPTALRGVKQVLTRVAAGQSVDDDVTRELRYDSYRSADLREGVTAFLERRSPNF